MTDIPLADVPRRLMADHGVTVPYRKLYTAVLDGRVTASRGDNGRWQIAMRDLPNIAEAFTPQTGPVGA